MMVEDHMELELALNIFFDCIIGPTTFEIQQGGMDVIAMRLCVQ
jgi:hypothetical protein